MLLNRLSFIRLLRQKGLEHHSYILQKTFWDLPQLQPLNTCHILCVLYITQTFLCSLKHVYQRLKCMINVELFVVC